MRSLFKACAALVALFLPSAAQADGRYDMYAQDGERIGLLEIIKDMNPDVVFFTIDTTNPVGDRLRLQRTDRRLRRNIQTALGRPHLDQHGAR